MPRDMENRKRWRLARTAKIVQFTRRYKTFVGCVDCGYRAHHAGLEFDHLFDKKMCVGHMAIHQSLDAVKREVRKCDVVCGTCHGIRTFNRRQALIS